MMRERAATKILPMELRVGDRFTDKAGEWEVIRPPFTTAAGKNAHASVRKIGQPRLTELRTWNAHERVNVKRATTNDGKLSDDQDARR
jgi:hypothetical protein